MQLKIFLLTLISVAALSAGHANDEFKRDNSVKDNNLFVLKADKKLIGATVEIYSSTGEFITSQSLQKSKMVIDFGEVKFGTYIIRVLKGQHQQEFQYVKLS